MASAAPKPRQRRLKPDDRRQLLIGGTLRCLAKYGAHGTGVRQVCRELAVAPSLVNYFFDGWNDLLLQAYRQLAERALAGYERIGVAPGLTARERLQALVEENISPAWLADEVVGAYIALWELSRTTPDLKAAFGRFHDARKHLIAGLFADLAAESAPSGDTDLLAASFVIFLDGLWLELGLNPDSIPPAQALAMGRHWIDVNVPEKRWPPPS